MINEPGKNPCSSASMHQSTHLLLQTRTQTLDGTLRETFRKWYPAMAANDTQMPAAAA